jgi:hypothetical protein
MSWNNKEETLSYNYKGKGTVKPRTGHTGPEGEYRYSLLFFFNFGARGGWSTPHPGRFPLERNKRLGGPQGRCGRVRNTSPPLGLDLRIVQHVASRFADWAVPSLTIIETVICQWKEHSSLCDYIQTELKKVLTRSESQNKVLNMKVWSNTPSL